MRSVRAHQPGGFRSSSHGGAAVEFAIVFPLFCALLFGTIDYGWYFYQRFTLATAIRDGVRVGVTIRPSVSTPSTPQAAAIARATTILTNAGMTPPMGAITSSQSTTTATGAPLKTLVLTGTLSFTPLVNFIRLPTAPMSYSMTMMFEQQE